MKGRLIRLLAAIVVLTFSLLYVRSRFLVVELSYSLSEKEALRSKLEQDKRALTLELATLRSPARVERIARRDLGLKRAASDISVVNVEEKTR